MESQLQSRGSIENEGEYAIYRYAAFFKDICIVLVLSGIFIEVRDIKKTLRGPDPPQTPLV